MNTYMYDYQTLKTLGGNDITVKVNPVLEGTLEEIVDFMGDCYIDTKEWKHQTLKELVYDFRPANAENFILKCTIHFSRNSYIEWFEYLLSKRLDKKRELELIAVNSFKDKDNTKGEQK